MAVSEKKLRLNVIARQLKVGQSTIVDFLEKKGIKIDNTPSAIIEPSVFEILNKEFGGKGVEGINIREKINQKNETITLKGVSESTKKEEEAPKEVLIKSTISSDMPTVASPKVVGKIDLEQPRKENKERKPNRDKNREKSEKPAARPANKPKKEEAKQQAAPKAKPQAWLSSW